MNETVKLMLEEDQVIYEATDAVFNNWNWNSNLKIPDLLGMLAVKLNWDDKQLKEADSVVRRYIRRHPDWDITRGATGGVQPMFAKQKKDAAKQAKAAVKQQLKAQIDAKVSQPPAALVNMADEVEEETV